MLNIDEMIVDDLKKVHHKYCIEKSSEALLEKLFVIQMGSFPLIF